MANIERETLKVASAEVQTWIYRLGWARRLGDDLDRELRRWSAAIQDHSFDVPQHDARVRVMPFGSSAGQLAGAVARRGALRPHLAACTPFEATSGRTAQALRDAAPVTSRWSRWSRKAKSPQATGAAQHLVRLHAWGIQTGIKSAIEEAERAATADVGVDLRSAESLADPRIPSAQWLIPNAPESVTWIRRDDLKAHCADVAFFGQARDADMSLRHAVTTRGNRLVEREVKRLLADMPVAALKETTSGRVRLNALEEHGISTVQQVLDFGPRLHSLSGIGETSASQIWAAANTVRDVTTSETPVRIDVQNRDADTTALLVDLWRWGLVRNGVKAAESAAADAMEALEPLRRAVDQGAEVCAYVSLDRSDEPPIPGWISAVHQHANDLRAVSQRLGSGDFPDAWEEFFRRPADYYALLSELGFLADDTGAAHGHLPDEIVAAVRRMNLRTDRLTVSLRGYQAFGAKFALVQRKVVIGDEMGLGKTVEALAVLAHLATCGASHFLVVCPAAVVSNWVREVAAKTDLRGHRLHGTERHSAAKSWIRNGGVAVTTFGSLRAMSDHLGEVEFRCLIVDEAHYIKNPYADRSARTCELIDRAERTLLMTGTPLENRVDEFRSLVSYLQPELAARASELSAVGFRKAVAPAYLRRNQEDVLVELPETVNVDDWVPLSDSDFAAYRDAVAEGNFMAMRRAALMTGKESAKLSRLREIVTEAEENGRKVIVFSFFRDVLREMHDAMPGEVYGPITGSVPAEMRQQMVDEFSMVQGGAVLLAQITAGGVGLNIQAASVVVICEPQIKPTMETQAIARAHRMGQVQTVQVHRLLSENCVDERIVEILKTKSELFDEFARVSDTAASAPEAIDISEAELARDVVAAERERLAKLATTQAAGASG